MVTERMMGTLQTGGPWLPGEEIPVNHGSYFWYAAKEGLLTPNQANIVSTILLVYRLSEIKPR
jgi:hypothetical protein